MSDTDDLTLKDEILIEYNKNKSKYIDSFKEELLKNAKLRLSNEYNKSIKNEISSSEDIVNDNLQKEAIKEITKIISKLGFKISQKIKKNNDYFILAKRSNLQECKFKFNLDGNITFKIHNYQGEGCIEDSEKILNNIERIYGKNVKVENVWSENPNLNQKMFHNKTNNIGR